MAPETVQFGRIPVILELGCLAVERPAHRRGTEPSIDGVRAAGELSHGSGLSVHDDVLPGGGAGV